jgi:hypothetical protein
MATQPVHSKILNQAAREVLAPLGLVQSGSSRLWIDDHGWWIIGVSFDPSSFGKGSYLGVSVNWLWTEEQGIAVHFGGSVLRKRRLLGQGGGQEWVPFESVEQFTPEAYRLARRAADKVRDYRAQFPDLTSMVRVLLRHPGDQEHGPGGDHHFLHLAIAYGLMGRPDEARRYFDTGIIDTPSTDWQRAQNAFYHRVRERVDDPLAFHAHVQRQVAVRRVALRLDPGRARELPAPPPMH